MRAVASGFGAIAGAVVASVPVPPVAVIADGAVTVDDAGPPVVVAPGGGAEAGVGGGVAVVVVVPDGAVP